ncbi:pentapeptide repeat-containing protein [Aliarcobacter butzleri]|uniref:pentapeptide repeat-containing protein n=2 Tax=Aliarcobacter butzleri TaxID=28197 RepID=UPI003AFB5353
MAKIDKSFNGNKNCNFELVLPNMELSDEEKEQHLINYYKHMHDDFIKVPVLTNDKNMTLNDIYIEPTFEFLSNHLKKEKDKYYNQFTTAKDNQSIHSFIYTYLNNKSSCNNEQFQSKNSNIVLILGQPGQGKSSFSKKFMFDYKSKIFDTKEQVFMLRLRDISNSSHLLDNPIDTLAEKLNKIIGFSPNLEEETILLLDGLDELTMKEKLVSSKIDDFLETLISCLKDYPKLKLIITSRTLYVNLEKLEKRLKDDILTLHLKAFDLEKQKLWLEKYKEFYPYATLTNEILDVLHENETNHILELISQPILLHMIAELNLSKDDLTNSTNRAKIYDEMFTSIINRKWEEDRKHENLKGIEPDDIRELLREIAFAIYKSDFQYIHKSKLEKLPFVKDFYENLEIDIDKNAEELDGILKGVLISFYFQEVNKNNQDDVDDSNNYAIEFLHKSLQEYLVAEKIYDEVLRLIDKDRKGKHSIKDYKEVLKIVWELFSSKTISKEIQNYLIEIIKNGDEEQNIELAQRMASLLGELFEKDFIYQYNLDIDVNIMKKSFDTFYGYWTILSNLGSSENFINKKFNEKYNIYITHLMRSNLECFGEATAIDYLYNFNFNYQKISSIYWVGCFFINNKFINSTLKYINFSKCYFIDIIFEKTIFYNCYFSHSHFNNCIFKETKINGCDFRDLNLNKINILNSELKNVNFTNSKMNKANFSNSKLVECNLKNANLEGIILDGAILKDIIIDDKNKKYLEKRGIEFTIKEDNEGEEIPF